jgi:drug/metabolite transporter (DMT)-like permease
VTLGPTDVGVGYAVLAALVWGGYLVVIKRYFGGYPPATVIVVTNSFALVWYVSVLAVSGSLVRPLVPGGVTAFEGLVMAATVGVFAAGVLSIFHALSIGDVSYVAPIGRIVPVFVLPMEVALFGGQLTSVQLLGLVVATLAVYLANHRGTDLLEPLVRAVTYRPGRLALLSAVLIAAVNVSQRVILQEFSLPPSVWVILLLGGVNVALAPVVLRTHHRDLRRCLDPTRVRWGLPLFAAAGLLVAVGEHVTALAFAAIPASIASPVVSTQAVVAVLLGGLLLREGDLPLRLAAAGLAVIGVTLVAAG